MTFSKNKRTFSRRISWHIWWVGKDSLFPVRDFYKTVFGSIYFQNIWTLSKTQTWKNVTLNSSQTKSLLLFFSFFCKKSPFFFSFWKKEKDSFPEISYITKTKFPLKMWWQKICKYICSFFLWDSEQQPYNDLKMCLDVRIQVLSCKFFNMPVVFIHVVSWLTSTGLLMQRRIWIGSFCICPVTQIISLLILWIFFKIRVFNGVIKSSLNTWLTIWLWIFLLMIILQVTG